MTFELTWLFRKLNCNISENIIGVTHTKLQSARFVDKIISNAITLLNWFGNCRVYGVFVFIRIIVLAEI